MTPSTPSLSPSFSPRPSPRDRAHGDEHTLGELFSELANETGTLVRKEVQLAQAEVTEKAKHAGKDAALVGVGAVLGHAGVLALVFALIVALASAMPLWASALIVGAALCAVGAILANQGVTKMKRIDPVPRATVQTLQDGERWAAREVKEVRS